MKTALISLSTAILLGVAAVAGGRLLDAADFIAIFFTIGLVTWTVAQYRRTLPVLITTKPVHLPIGTVNAPARRTSLVRQAA